jgi:hypothetical protein
LNAIRTVPIDSNNESRLFEYMKRDRISHFYSIYDLQHLRDKTRAWVAISGNEVVGYLTEFDKRILTLRGRGECVAALLKNSDLATSFFNIEPSHLSVVKEFYEPIEPADKTTIGTITSFLTMKATPESFRPFKGHEVKELPKDAAKSIERLLGVDHDRAESFLTGLALGVFRKNELVSFAASPERIDDIAIMRGVFTASKERNKNYSKSVCSALVEKLVHQSRVIILYVSKDNPAAIKVYSTIGFKETGQLLLGFVAKNKKEV